MGYAKWAACGQCSYMECKVLTVLNIANAIVLTHRLKPQNGPTQIQIQNQNKKICMTIQSAIVCCYGDHKAAEKENTNCKMSERDQ